MPLTEDEEFELLSLERERAMGMRDAMAPAAPEPDGLMSSIKKGFLDQPIQGKEGFDMTDVGQFIGRSGPSIVGGTIGSLAGPAGTGLGAAAGEAWRRAAREAIVPSGNVDVIGSVTGPAIEGTGQYIGAKYLPAAAKAVTGSKAGRAVGEYISSKAGELKQGAQKLGAQVIRAATGVPERSAMRAIKDPTILSGPGRKAAGEAYNKAVTEMNIVPGEEGVRQTFGKSVLSKEKIYDIWDEMAPQLQDGNVSLQKAFSLRKAISDQLGDTNPAERESMRRLTERIRVLDDYIEKQLPEWGGLRKGYADALAAEEFNSWMPLNKNLSPNVLRSWGAVATGAGGLASGNPAMMAAPLLVSPKAWGYGIRAATFPGRMADMVPGTVSQSLSRAAAPATAAYAINSTEELMRKYMEKK